MGHQSENRCADIYISYDILLVQKVCYTRYTDFVLFLTGCEETIFDFKELKKIVQLIKYLDLTVLELLRFHCIFKQISKTFTSILF